MNRLLINIAVSDLRASKHYYTDLFGFEVSFDSDWFVHLVAEDNKTLELGLIKSDCEIVPRALGNNPSGLYITIVVDDVTEIYQKAVQRKYPIIEEPSAMFYGQNRMLLEDPSGCILDVSSVITN